MRKLMNVDLNLFDGEGGSATGEGTASPAAEGNTGDYSNVKFGVQEAEPTESAADSTGEEEVPKVPTLEERRKAYHDFINSDDYKEFYTEDTQKMINRRFKETKNLERQIADFQPLLDILGQKYGENDIHSITKAIEDDHTYWESAADEAGMTVEQFKRIKKLERENKALIQRQNYYQREQKVNEQLQRWNEQTEEVKGKYPDFDLEREAATNEDFRRLITDGKVDLLHAYEVVHMDEIKNNISKATAEATTKAVVDNIKAKGSRPIENGIASNTAFTVKSDVTKLTRKDREEIARRVARGERVSF